MVNLIYCSFDYVHFGRNDYRHIAQSKTVLNEPLFFSMFLLDVSKKIEIFWLTLQPKVCKYVSAKKYVQLLCTHFVQLCDQLCVCACFVERR